MWLHVLYIWQSISELSASQLWLETRLLKCLYWAWWIPNYWCKPVTYKLYKNNSGAPRTRDIEQSIRTTKIPIFSPRTEITDSPLKYQTMFLKYQVFSDFFTFLVLITIILFLYTFNFVVSWLLAFIPMATTFFPCISPWHFINLIYGIDFLVIFSRLQISTKRYDPCLYLNDFPCENLWNVYFLQ